MHIFWKAPLTALLLTAPLLAGGMWLEVGTAAANPEAAAKNAVLTARITACHSPEKTQFVAAAEGLTKSGRVTIPLKLVPLSKPGTFAVLREWTERGDWVVKIVATNPEYANYATSVVVPVKGDSFDWASVKHYRHAPTSAEVDDALGEQSAAVFHR
jgi:hypothetical protein